MGQGFDGPSRKLLQKSNNTFSHQAHLKKKKLVVGECITCASAQCTAPWGSVLQGIVKRPGLFCLGRPPPASLGHLGPF